MEQRLEGNGIYKAMVNVMKEVDAVAKDRNNPQQGYKFRGVEDVMNMLQPKLAKHGIFMTSEMHEEVHREEKASKSGGILTTSIVTLTITFHAEDGSSVSSCLPGEGMDSGDKSLNKALSAAYKYIMFQVFCIPTEDLKDSEDESPEPEKQTTPKNPPETRQDAQGKEPAHGAREILLKKVHALGSQIGWDHERMKQEYTQQFQVTSMAEMSAEQLEQFCDYLDTQYHTLPIMEVQETEITQLKPAKYLSILDPTFLEVVSKNVRRKISALNELSIAEADKIIELLKKSKGAKNETPGS